MAPPPIDYSIWDKIEISDDEDIECHPNIDKRSLIKWRKEKLYQEREERRNGIKQYKSQLSWIEKYMDVLGKHTAESLASATSLPDDIKDVLGEFAGLPDDIVPTPLVGRATPQIFELFLANVHRHRDFARAELEKLENEESKHLTTDKICHTGFDSKTIFSAVSTPASTLSTTGVMSTASSATNTTTTPAPSSSSSSSSSSSAAAAEACSKDEAILQKSSKLSKEIESDKKVLSNTVVSGAEKKTEIERAFASRPKEDCHISSPVIYHYASLNHKDYSEIYSYLSKERATLLASGVSDEILASAFEYGMAAAQSPENSAKLELRIEQYVHLSTILQYIASLGQDGPSLFFSRLTNLSHPANQLFHDQCKQTVEHIRRRSRVNYAKKTSNFHSRINLSADDAKLDVLRDLPDNVRDAIFAENMELLEQILNSLPKFQADKIRSKLKESHVFSEATEVGGDSNGDFVNDGRMVSSADPDLQAKLLEQLPQDFANALLSGDGAKVSELLDSYSQEEAERILKVCQEGDFLELRDDQKTEH